MTSIVFATDFVHVNRDRRDIPPCRDEVDVNAQVMLIFSYFIFIFSYLILLRRVALQLVDFQGALG